MSLQMSLQIKKDLNLKDKLNRCKIPLKRLRKCLKQEKYCLGVKTALSMCINRKSKHYHSGP